MLFKKTFKIWLLILEKEEKGERKRNINWLPPIHAPTGYQIHNLGMCPKQELNLPPFGVWEYYAQTKESHKPGLKLYLNLRSDFKFMSVTPGVLHARPS